MQTIEGTIQRLQPLLQSVAIGSLTAEEAIANIDRAFGDNESESNESPETDTLSVNDEVHLSEETVLSDNIDPNNGTEDVGVPKRLSIDDIANMTIQTTMNNPLTWSNDGGSQSSDDALGIWRMIL